MEKSHCYRFVIFDTGQIKVDRVIFVFQVVLALSMFQK